MNRGSPRSVSACSHMEPNQRSKPHNRVGACRCMPPNKRPSVCCKKGADKNAPPPYVTQNILACTVVARHQLQRLRKAKTTSKRSTLSFGSAICKLPPSTNRDAATCGSRTGTLYHTRHEKYVFFVLFYRKDTKLGGCVYGELLSTIQHIVVRGRCSRCSYKLQVNLTQNLNEMLTAPCCNISIHKM